MQGNMTQMIAEAVRQGQAETERRLVMMKAVQGQFGGANPLVDHFRGDPEIGRLQVDAEIMTSLFDKKCYVNPFVWCPILWAHAIIMNVPCNYLCTRAKLKKVADAHQLTLHEKSLKLKVDPYPGYLQNAQSAQALMIPWCCATCVADTSPIEEVIPLTDVESVRIEPCQLKQCGSAVAPDTFVVRTTGSSFPLFAVDAPNPEQAEKFIGQIMNQVNTAKEVAMHDAPLPESWAKYQSSLYGAGMGMMGMMGMNMAMMGGAPGQMQMNRGAAYQHQGAGGLNSMVAANVANTQALQMQMMANMGVPPQQPMGAVIATAEPVPSAPAADDTAAQLAKIDGLKKSGAISEAEYQAMRKKALGL